jgi:hypothetical protein
MRKRARGLGDANNPPMKAGELIYWNSCFNGLIPCKVLERKQGIRENYVVVRITADRGPWKKGENVWIHPSEACHRRRVF